MCLLPIAIRQTEIRQTYYSYNRFEVGIKVDTDIGTDSKDDRDIY